MPRQNDLTLAAVTADSEAIADAPSLTLRPAAVTADADAIVEAPAKTDRPDTERSMRLLLLTPLIELTCLRAHRRG